MTQTPHRRDALATLLWPNFDQTGARYNLRRTLSALYQTLDHQWLVIDRTTIHLPTHPDLWVDDAFPDGTCFVSLAPVGEVEFLVAAIAEALRLSFDGKSAPKDQAMARCLYPCWCISHTRRRRYSRHSCCLLLCLSSINPAYHLLAY